MRYYDCPGCRLVRDMQSMIEFDELTGYEDDYKKMFKELVKKYFEGDKEDEANQVVESKTGQF